MYPLCYKNNDVKLFLRQQLIAFKTKKAALKAAFLK